jgi:glutathionylspermidine synthase
MATTEEYATFAGRLIEDGVLVDPWFEGAPRFGVEPLVITRPRLEALGAAAEAVTAVYDELCGLCAAEPRHLTEFFGLTPFQQLMWAASAPQWHGFARADLFETAAGIVCCELNCDTPTGQPEAVLLNRAALAARPGLCDPNARLEAAVGGLIERLGRAAFGEGFERTVGIVYPTELTEDLPLVRLYERWLTACGFDVVLGSPYNLTLNRRGEVTLFGAPCRVILRHYKTDWWGERAPVWTDEEPFADPDPLDTQLGVLFEGLLGGQVVVVNPFASVVPQNKRAMAFMWEHLPRFSKAARATIERHVPYTVRLEALHPEQLAAEREDWVLKSDYGCEGDAVVVGRRCTEAEWEAALAAAAPGRFVAQRYFAAAEGPAGEIVNYGVYLVGGDAAGLYCRAGAGPTDAWTRSVPCLVAPEDA